MFPARALETAREARALPTVIHPKMILAAAVFFAHCDLVGRVTPYAPFVHTSKSARTE
jgi:hypothetical protein